MLCCEPTTEGSGVGSGPERLGCRVGRLWAEGEVSGGMCGAER